MHPSPNTATSTPPKCVNNDGYCLEQTDFGYLRRNDCCCNPELCPNNFVCGGTAPKHIMQAHGGRCLSCDIIFGADLKLTALEAECDCCSDQERLIHIPGCEHRICMTCFRTIYLSDETDELPEGDRGRCPVPECRNPMTPAWKS